MPLPDGLHLHTPGALSRWGVVDVGLKCTHSCRHCFYSYLDGSDDQFAGMRRAKWHGIDNLKVLVDSLADHGFLGFDITGGEPGAYPYLVELVAHAAVRGLAPRVITLGQFLGKRDLLARLLDAGLVDFRFSLHAVEPAMFKAMTGGELSLLLAAMDELAARGFQYITNTTITEQNYKALPAIGRFIAARPDIYASTFLFFMPYYQWARAAHAGDHRVSYTEIAGYLREAVAAVEEAGIAATIRYAPACTIAGMERNHVGIVGVRHDTHEWMNAIDHSADPAAATEASMRAMGAALPLARTQTQFPLRDLHERAGDIELFAGRLHSGKVFPASCRGCQAIHVCDGVDRAYLAAYGDGEFKPTKHYRGYIIDEARLNYPAAGVIKLKPYADARAATRALLNGEKLNVAAA